jgi:inositol phosphorylceramide synthase catalytic subunit
MPVQSLPKWKLLTALAVLGYLSLVNQIIHVRPDHVFIAFFIFACLFGKESARRFLIDWAPFILFWVAYDLMRGLVDNWRGAIHIREIYEYERLLTGWFTHEILPFRLQWFSALHDGRWYKEALDLVCANLYSFHFFIPLTIGWLFWHTVDDRRLFYRFVWTLTVCNAMALVTFFLYPAAPPWYVYLYGFQPPGPELYGAAGALINIDRMIDLNFMTTLWDNFNANHFAAVPSLHGAYPVAVGWLCWKKFHRFRWVCIGYPAMVWFAAMYLNHHYLLDLLIGLIYLLVAFAVTDRLLLPHIFNKRLRPAVATIREKPELR